MSTERDDTSTLRSTQNVDEMLFSTATLSFCSMSSALPQGAQGFLEAFKSAGGWYDASLFSLQEFFGMGWGGVALKDIEPDTPLFHIPSSLLLTPYTSSLASKLSEAEWTALEVGWARLILVMMYETALGSASRWHAYLGESTL